MSNNIGNLADFTLKVIIMFTTFISLLYYTTVFTFSFMFIVLALLFLIALITKGISDALGKRNR